MDDNQLALPRVVCAALRFDGVIVASPRHFDKTAHGIIDKLALKISPGKWEQGFVDQFGNFLTREEAWITAEKNGQIIRTVSSPGILYSENLY